MSFDPQPSHYVNGSFIVWHLVDIVAKGGQMQIGYGPDADGEFDPLAVQALEYAGRWLETNGDAIYYSRPLVHADGVVSWNDTASSQVRYTRSKDNATIYAIALSGFGSASTGATLTLADVVPTPGSEIYLLGYEHEANRTLIPIEWSPGQAGAGGAASGAVLTVPTDVAAHPAVMDPGMAFMIKGAPTGGW